MMYRIENTRAAILRVQSMLRALSYTYSAYPHVPKDGIFGSETTEAVILFQKDHGLEPTGRVNYVTFVALRDARDALPTDDASVIISFPLARGAQGEDVSMLHSLLRKFNRLHPFMLSVPAGAYYSAESEEAVRSLARFFGVSTDGSMSEGLYHRLISYLRAYGEYNQPTHAHSE